MPPLPWTPFRLVSHCARKTARPCLFFFPSKSSQYSGTVLFGYIEPAGLGELFSTPCGDHGGETPSHFTTCFDDDFAAPDEQPRHAIVSGQFLLCTSQPKKPGDWYAGLEDSELVTCPGCLAMLAERARISSAVRAAQAAVRLDDPQRPVTPSVAESAARIAAALEKIALGGVTVWKGEV